VAGGQAPLLVVPSDDADVPKPPLCGTSPEHPCLGGRVFNPECRTKLSNGEQDFPGPAQALSSVSPSK